MNRFVLDRSVTMGWVFEDEADTYGDAVFQSLREAEALVPALWRLEVANALLVAVRRNRLPEAKAVPALDLLNSLRISVDGRPASLHGVFAVAKQHGLSVYDAAYLDLAMRSGLPLATKDGKLRAASEAAGIPAYAV